MLLTILLTVTTLHHVAIPEIIVCVILWKYNLPLLQQYCIFKGGHMSEICVSQPLCQG